MGECCADIPGKNPFEGFDILDFSKSVIAITERRTNA